MGKFYDKEGRPNHKAIAEMRKAVSDADNQHEARKKDNPEYGSHTANIPKGGTFVAANGIAPGTSRSGARSSGDKSEKSR